MASNQNIFGAFNQQANQDHCLDKQEEELSKKQKASKTGLKCQKSCWKYFNNWKRIHPTTPPPTASSHLMITRSPIHLWDSQLLHQQFSHSQEKLNFYEETIKIIRLNVKAFLRWSIIYSSPHFSMWWSL